MSTTSESRTLVSLSQKQKPQSASLRAEPMSRHTVWTNEVFATAGAFRLCVPKRTLAHEVLKARKACSAPSVGALQATKANWEDTEENSTRPSALQQTIGRDFAAFAPDPCRLLAAFAPRFRRLPVEFLPGFSLFLRQKLRDAV
ncbi:hypothetical protein [Ellagibacter isourolithinifaciens]|uniref:hypothetical protein n=1 Tax=Ellagibacter isourolithinifaciens TaxID=2137581 RepID=UPI003A927F4B